jgi:hypothetical protein
MPEVFRINRKITAICRSEKTRYGFRHLAELQYNGREVGHAKACYYNRTWERYQFQTVIFGAIENAKNNLTVREYNAAKRWAEVGDDRDMRPLRIVAAVAAIGSIISPDQKTANDWKARMLRAGLEGKGLEMPGDWATLSEDEKERRLNGAINALKS